MRRVPTQELLDDDLGTPEEIARSMDDLWRINLWLGGVKGSCRLLEKCLVRSGLRRARVLDVGAGDARLAQHLSVEFKKRGYELDFVALDRRASHLGRAGVHRNGVRAVAADVFALPFREPAFDVVMCNLFFHHFSGGDARRLLRHLASAARLAVLVNDLERRFWAYAFIRVAWPFATSRLTRNDGPASVRQAYTLDELADLTRSSGFRNFEIERLPFYRLGLTLWSSPHLAKR